VDEPRGSPRNVMAAVEDKRTLAECLFQTAMASSPLPPLTEIGKGRMRQEKRGGWRQGGLSIYQSINLHLYLCLSLSPYVSLSPPPEWPLSGSFSLRGRSRGARRRLGR